MSLKKKKDVDYTFHNEFILNVNFVEHIWLPLFAFHCFWKGNKYTLTTQWTLIREICKNYIQLNLTLFVSYEKLNYHIH